MRLKEFAKTGRKLPEIGMGTYYDPMWIAGAFLGWRKGADEKVRAVRGGLEAGMAIVDTAEIYKSEPLVAKSMKGVKRDDVFLATKAWSNHLHRDALVSAFEKSLRRLGTTYVDLYQVHFPNPRVPIRETMGAMEELVEAGKLRYIGVSNFSLEQTEEANSILPRSQLSSVQLSYSLAYRNVEADILPYCEKEGIALLAYYPLGHGKLASSAALDEVARKHGKTRAQVAVNWLARKANVFPIPRASSEEHVQENVGASGWDMLDEEVSMIEARLR